VVANHTTLSRTTIGVIAARASVFLEQAIVETAYETSHARPQNILLERPRFAGKVPRKRL
jgi:hypothetical protein